METAEKAEHAEGGSPQGSAPTSTAPAAAAKAKTIHVSPRALLEIEKLQAKRVADGKPRSHGLRVGIRGGGCTGFGYLFEWSDGEPRKTDQVFEFAGSTGEPLRIFCDPKSLIYLDGTTLDFVSSVMGHGFKFVNPNVKGSCGCGESVQF